MAYKYSEEISVNTALGYDTLDMQELYWNFHLILDFDLVSFYFQQVKYLLFCHAF